MLKLRPTYGKVEFKHFPVVVGTNSRSKRREGKGKKWGNEQWEGMGRRVVFGKGAKGEGSERWDGV